ncbi:uncharacterized protein LY89DRAFT_590988 [Mollisia scopiformis]|uniref:Uncharacterized protein n=1 Tax=Mollisia scopiformis TaxID=149040 RepID=A0A194X123_MOLSC|nr:uncharacterized protein LY89DRAFT_590988 [Mollisia scopiformis]KUJ13669.1 hypothetical protein LY89DRAFT_590988 [Mollisia scopiformis]
MYLHTLCTFLLLSTIRAHEATQYLTTTAVVTDHNDHAYLECWQFSTPFKTYPTVGQSLFLGHTTNITYVVLPPRSEEGIHKPPAPMFFMLLSGLAHITFPYNDEEAWVMEGVNGLLVANDIKGIGHYTTYPSDKETVALQVPFEGGVVPQHKILGRGACHHTSHSGSFSGALGTVERADL